MALYEHPVDISIHKPVDNEMSDIFSACESRKKKTI